jgi:predicted RecB family nuclease
MTAKLTTDVLEAYLDCKLKGHLKQAGQHGTRSDYDALLIEQRQEVRRAAVEKILARHADDTVVRGIPLTAAALKRGPLVVLDAAFEDDALCLRVDALKRVDGPSKLGEFHYSPVLFDGAHKVGKRLRLLLEVYGLLLSRLQGRTPTHGVVWHGKDCRPAKLRLGSDPRKAERLLQEVQRLNPSEPPRLVLNDHCQVCEFRQRCRAAAVERDDLSLLRGLSAKEIAALNARGIFTVTQYSYTFRPGRMKRATGRKHDHSLQALAIREKTVYIAKRPELPAGKARVYLDVEGLPDEEFYYLIGMTVVGGESRRHLSFWANSPAEEASVWTAFLAAVGTLGGFVLFHYGSYESKFLQRMEARHGGDAELIARIKSSCVNVLSFIYGRVYFPAYGNDLKSVAGCLGFRWSAAVPSGLQTIAWRQAWQTSGDESVKRQLLAYNEEDCSALEMVEGLLRSLGDGRPLPPGGIVPPVASLKEAPGPYRHQFGATKFALPEFSHLIKRAYFDYQREKVLCRTTPRLRQVVRSQKGRKRRAWKVNREVEWGRPAACPHCGSTALDTKMSQRKLVIDLEPIRGGIKRKVTRHKARRYSCRKCLSTFLPPEYLALPAGYGRGVCGWVVYSSISLRQSNEAVGEALGELFGVRFGRGYASKVRRRAAERYRPTYEALVSALRRGLVVHADETKVKMKGSVRDGYVWAFANPETAVYVYAPTRDGDTARQTLAGFQGVLVSDFYSAYDSLACPQQKCLVHLIRDINDDLLKNPFDDELKLQAARFTGVLQPIIGTVDRYGLKQYRLNKHQKDVDRFFAAESRAAYGSETARHYQHRLLKYRDKLFTFLAHDGVPWNNNNAENAVKQFASRRKTIGQPFTEAGIHDYLLLLSIYQTLRYRNASFWRFLLSGETDIDVFTAKRR